MEQKQRQSFFKSVSVIDVKIQLLLLAKWVKKKVKENDFWPKNHKVTTEIEAPCACTQ